MAHVSQVARCGSPWACPLCAPSVRSARAKEIDLGVSRWLARGGGVEFATFTVRHHQGDRLGPRFAVMAQCLGVVLKGAPWERRKAALGYRGAIRSVEVVWTFDNGWHPHLHAVLFFERPLTVGERAELEWWMFGRWSGVCAARGFGSVDRRFGVVVKGVTVNDGVGEYMAAKVEDGWGAGLELARGDLKLAPSSDALMAAAFVGAVTPFAMLAEFASTGDVVWRDRWLEYEAATFGRHAIEWSRGLRKLLIPEVEEATDVELASVEGADAALWRVAIPAREWDGLVRSGEVALVLDDIEAVCAVQLLLCVALGIELRPLEEGFSGLEVMDDG